MVLKKNRVFILNGKLAKKDIVAMLINSICDDLPEVDRQDVLKSVLKREEGISTTLDTGLSIPHARLEDLKAFEAAVAILPQQINDDYGLPIKVMYLFLSPSGPAFFSQHLKMLASLAEKFNTEFINDLTTQTDTRVILDKIL